ncbi:MAG: hypothetical protein IPK22_11495 [Verrucomicrobiaceae bacterium]|nr:hypothetical protein [Verrucomicrobiaceae bacterium]
MSTSTRILTLRLKEGWWRQISGASAVAFDFASTRPFSESSSSAAV